MTIKELCKLSHKMAVEKGFWATEKGISGDTNLLDLDLRDTCKLEKRNDGELIALMHSELSECLEGLRHGDPESDKIKGFSTTEEEMADLFIRAGDFCEARDLRIEEAIKAKMKYNSKRPIKHGKKF